MYIIQSEHTQAIIACVTILQITLPIVSVTID
jgi:hypothetical protein